MIIRQISVLPESDRVAAVSAQAPHIQQIVFEWRSIPQSANQFAMDWTPATVRHSTHPEH